MNDAEALAAFVGSNRERITAAFWSSPRASQATIGTHVRIAELLDQLARAHAPEGREAYRSWLQTTISHTDAAAQREAMLDIWDAIRSAGAAGFGALDSFEGDARRIIASWKLPAAHAAHAAFDEIDAAIESCIVRLDSCSPLTAEHSRAVSAWAIRIARRLALSDGECVHARRGGLIHDIGKATTPAEILEAPRALTDAEWVLMRSHTTAGASELQRRELLHDFIPAVRSHHERLDGKGYPDGLRGDGIPIVVRIITVADCFNAMVGRRPYRKPMPPTRALDELQRNRGTQFDPDVVDAMLDIVGA